MSLSEWIESRTSLRTVVRNILDTPTVGGPRCRNVWGAVVLFLFALQALTGLLLMTVYSPSTTTAWGSVWYVQTQVPAGWLIRGLHHFGSDAMLIVVALHCLYAILAKAYKAPRELIWWLSVMLLGLTLALSLSGHLLPWDQEGYWGTRVRTNILARTPVIGDVLRRLVVGGVEFGHLTLTRFYTLHVLVLPGLAVLLVLWRTAMGRKRWATTLPAGDTKAAEPYWPGQGLRDAIACSVTLAVVLGALWYTRAVVGSELLAAPADPATSDYPARPEWHTLFFYQWLKSFSGPIAEVIGAIVVPGAVVLVFFAFPFLNRLLRARMAHALVLGVTGFVVAGVTWLTFAAVRADLDPTDRQVGAAQAKQAQGERLTEAEETVVRARQFNRQRARAASLARRALTLASSHGIPPEGPLQLLANDPVTRGPVLFAAHCASCHRFYGHDGLGDISLEPATSSDLGGYASREWIRGLLADPMNERYFGRMTKPDGEPAHTRMSRFIGRALERNDDEADRRRLLENFDAVAAYLEDESFHRGRLAHIIETDGNPSDDVAETAEEETILQGRRFFLRVCNECHSYKGERTGTFKAPEMLGYGSIEWIELMIADPSHETRYRSTGREPAQMPPFQDRLSARDRRMIAEWLHATRTADAIAP